MEVESKRTKGGFFHLFDWNGKSRKKLFVNNPEFPEGLKQGKENAEKMAKPQLHMTELDDRRANLRNRGSSDFSCSSSVASDEGCGTRAPGAVARLMGLDSLPISNVAEPSFTLGFDSHSLRAFPYDRSTPNLWSEYNPMDYRNTPNKQEKYAWNSMESRLHKVENRPITRFQTEGLPPKLAKSSPVTHHKLLSPIKNPGFTPTKNVAYIMEAAAKIIEASPKASSTGKIPSIGTSSNSKEQQSDKRRSGSEGLPSAKASTGSEKGTPDSLRNKGKSVPIATQAKSNARRRDRSTSRSKSIVKQKEQNEVKANQLLKNQHCSQNAIQKRTFESRTNNVLQQNNLKQNFVPNKGSSTLKNSVSNQQGSKTQSTSGSVGQCRTVNKIVVKPEIMPRKISSVMMDSEKEKKKNISRKKQSVSGDLQIDKSVSPNVSFNKDGKSTKSNVVNERNMNMAMDNRKNGMDVVSFTFSSPIKRATPSSQSSGQMSDKHNNSAIDLFGSNDHPSFRSSTSYFPGEETSATSSPSLENSLSTPNVASSSSARLDKKLQIVHDKDRPDSLGYFDCILVEKS
ncbi:GPI-ANCHORED ADHESIN-LIKE PROTEIN [Salix purpurea]|uniref:GPI-ANCHORED ADHESIN-LIKE PROTEIN n=1 Tax=Salix purpurea TaxID=77065 RepID=A0A9Q1A9A5_SALPP|nr:GPI-ANCHORED ADHESIN-LIKE PROTEIN [Salix purpurea]